MCGSARAADNDAKQGSKHFGQVHDTIFFYSGSDDYTFTHQYRPYDPEYIEKFYKHVEPGTGRRYTLGDITAPGGAAEAKGNPFYEFRGVERYWRFSKAEMERLHKAGAIVQAKPGAVPRQKRYLDPGKGVPIGTVWDDIGPIQSSAEERRMPWRYVRHSTDSDFPKPLLSPPVTPFGGRRRRGDIQIPQQILFVGRPWT